MIFEVFSLVSSGPGAFAKIRTCAHRSTVVDRAQGAIVLERNYQEGNQRNAVSPADELAAGPLQSSSGRLARHPESLQKCKRRSNGRFSVLSNLRYVYFFCVKIIKFFVVLFRKKIVWHEFS